MTTRTPRIEKAPAARLIKSGSEKELLRRDAAVRNAGR